jgi:hypothetical protein
LGSFYELFSNYGIAEVFDEFFIGLLAVELWTYTREILAYTKHVLKALKALPKAHILQNWEFSIFCKREQNTKSFKKLKI